MDFSTPTNSKRTSSRFGPRSVRERTSGIVRLTAAPALAGMLFLAATLLSGGCATLSSQNHDEDALQVSPHRHIGYVVWVDASENIAVVRTNQSPGGSWDRLISRNDIMIRTAHLEVTDMREGRSVGVRILQGLPNIGDEVVTFGTGN